MIHEFTATGQSDTITISGKFNVSLWDTFVATIVLQRSFDQGKTWLTVETYTSTAENFGTESETAIYRWNCTSYTSGNVQTRINVA